MGALGFVIRINLGLVVLLAVLFALPFATVSCSSTTLIQTTGYQLALGSSPDNVLTAAGRQIVASSTSLDISGRKPPLWSATLALIFILLAGVLSLLKAPQSRATALRAGIAFGLGAIALFMVQNELQRAWQYHGYALMPFVLSMQPAYWIALTLVILAAVANFASAMNLEMSRA